MSSRHIGANRGTSTYTEVHRSRILRAFRACTQSLLTERTYTHPSGNACKKLHPLRVVLSLLMYIFTERPSSWPGYVRNDTLPVVASVLWIFSLYRNKPSALFLASFKQLLKCYGDNQRSSLRSQSRIVPLRVKQFLQADDYRTDDQFATLLDYNMCSQLSFLLFFFSQSLYATLCNVYRDSSFASIYLSSLLLADTNSLRFLQ